MITSLTTSHFTLQLHTPPPQQTLSNLLRNAGPETTIDKRKTKHEIGPKTTSEFFRHGEVEKRGLLLPLVRFKGGTEYNKNPIRRAEPPQQN